MRRIIDVTLGQDEHILKLIGAGKYHDYQSFIGTAIDNQLLIEVSGAGDLLSAVQQTGATVNGSIERMATRSVADDLETTHALPADAVNDGSDPSRWLWGQINSVLAIKFSTREIARVLSYRPESTLKALSGVVAQAAAAIAPRLVEADSQLGNGRGERFATSFPSPSEKSQDRFANQYVGARRLDERYDGALFQLGLLGITAEGLPRLTRRGFDFANLENPVLDGGPLEKARWLSDQEERFYIQEVVTNTAVEANPMRWILAAIPSGIVDRSRMIDDLAKAKPEWSPSQVETYRVGATSRSVQLRVLRLTASGREVTYQLGPNADLARQVLRNQYATN